MRQGLQAAAHQVSMEVKQVRGGLCSLAAGCSAAGRHVARALVHHRAKTPAHAMDALNGGQAASNLLEFILGPSTHATLRCAAAAAALPHVA